MPRRAIAPRDTPVSVRAYREPVVGAVVAQRFKNGPSIGLSIDLEPALGLWRVILEATLGRDDGVDPVLGLLLAHRPSRGRPCLLARPPLGPLVLLGVRLRFASCSSRRSPLWLWLRRAHPLLLVAHP